MKISNKENRRFLLLELLEKFDKKELKGLRHFVSCRYFNTDQYVVKLLEMLVNEVVGKKAMDENIRSKVYEKIFGSSMQGSKEKATFNAKMNALTRLTERFLTIEALENQEVYANDLLLSKLREKQEYALFNRHTNRFKKQAVKEKKGSRHHEQQVKIQWQLLKYYYTTGVFRKTDNLNEINRQLDLYYLLQKLDLYLTANSFQKYFKDRKYVFLNSKEIEYLCAIPKYTHHPVVATYLATIRLNNDRNTQNYDALFSLLEKFESQIPATLLSESTTVLTNFCADQIKRGNTDFYQQQFELYLILEEKNLLLENNAMPVRKFKNLVATACHIGEYDWAEQIIKKYSPFVNEKDREDIRNFNLGALALYRGDYEGTKDYFSIIYNRINPIYDINLKLMVAKCDYETGLDYDRTVPSFETTEKYIQQLVSMKKEDKPPYKRFIRMLINLFRIKHRVAKKTLESVKKELETTQHISDKKWLEEKIKELEARPPKRF